MSETLQDQVIELQTRLTFQEDALQQLNDVIATQDTYIRALQQQLQSLGVRVGDMAHALAEGGARPQDERPPHY